MLKFIQAQIEAYGLPIYYERRPAVFGNEVEFRWRRYYNSATPCLKIEYNVSDEEHEAICATLIECWRRANFRFEIHPSRQT